MANLVKSAWWWRSINRGGNAVPDMLANWVADDSTQEVNGGLFGTAWVDRVGGYSFPTNTVAYIMHDTAFNGHKAMKVRDNIGSTGLDLASPCGISTDIQDYTFFFAMRPKEVSLPEKTMFMIDNPILGEDFIAYYFLTSKPNDSGQVFSEGLWSSYNGTGDVADIQIGVDKIYTVDCQGDDVRWFKNNVQFSTNAGLWSSRAINEGFSCLALWLNGTRVNESYTAEIRIYPALTAVEREMVTDEMKVLYGIT